MGKAKVREHLAEFQKKYLQPLHINHRKAVYVSEDTQKRLGYVVRKIGEQGASISGYVEQVLQEHLDQYKNDVETWRKLWTTVFTERKPMSSYRIHRMQ